MNKVRRKVEQRRLQHRTRRRQQRPLPTILRPKLADAIGRGIEVAANKARRKVETRRLQRKTRLPLPHRRRIIHRPNPADAIASATGATAVNRMHHRTPRPPRHRAPIRRPPIRRSLIMALTIVTRKRRTRTTPPTIPIRARRLTDDHRWSVPADGRDAPPFYRFIYLP